MSEISFDCLARGMSTVRHTRPTIIILLVSLSATRCRRYEEWYVGVSWPESSYQNAVDLPLWVGVELAQLGVELPLWILMVTFGIKFDASVSALCEWFHILKRKAKVLVFSARCLDDYCLEAMRWLYSSQGSRGLGVGSSEIQLFVSTVMMQAYWTLPACGWRGGTSEMG